MTSQRLRCLRDATDDHLLSLIVDPPSRTSLKEDTNTLAAELVYGTMLRIPGELVVDSDSIVPQQIYVERLRRHMRKI